MADKLREIVSTCRNTAGSLLTATHVILKAMFGLSFPRPLSDLHAEFTLRLSKTITLMATFTQTIVRSRRKPK